MLRLKTIGSFMAEMTYRTPLSMFGVRQGVNRLKSRLCQPGPTLAEPLKPEPTVLYSDFRCSTSLM